MLWLYFQASLKATLENIEELRVQQAQEMQEVENYVEHIRQLSDEREALTERSSMILYLVAIL